MLNFYHFLKMSQRASLLCAAVSLLAYLNSLDLQFCFDDSFAILLNPDVTQAQNSSWTNLLVNDYWGMPIRDRLSCKSYRPLCVATFRLNYLLHELQPMGYHLVNVLLHGAVCYLYVQLCGVVFSQVLPALIAGLLFAVHPIHTEAVAGLVGRAELLSGIFFILTILFYRQAVSSHSYFGLIAGLMMSFLLSVLATLSKEQGITAVGICCVYDLFGIIFSRKNRIKVKRKTKSTEGTDSTQSLTELCTFSFNPSLVGVVARCSTLMLFTGVMLKLRVTVSGSSPSFYIVGLGAHSLESPWLRGLNYFYLAFVNLWLLVNPSFLCADWTGRVLELIVMTTDPRNLLTIATFSTLSLMVVFGLRTSSRPLLLSLALMIIPFVPASNLFFPVGFVVAERVLYLPSMGFCMLVALGVWRLMQRYKHVKVFLLGLLIVHMLKTGSRNRDWYSNETLALSGIKLTQENSKFFTMLAKVYSQRGDHGMSEVLTRLAVSVQPQDPLLKRKLVHSLQAQMKFDDAEILYEEMINLMTKNGTKLIGKKRLGRLDINVYAEYAHMLLRDSNKLHRAAEMLQNAVLVEPNSTSLMAELGEVLLKLNEPLKAVAVLEKASSFENSSPQVFSYLGTAYTWIGRMDKAEVYLKKALKMVPSHGQLLMTLAFVLHQSDTHKQLKSAVHLYEQVLLHQPNSVHAALQLGDTHTKLGNYAEAVDAYARAREMSSRSSKPLYKLAVAYKALERHSEAKKILRTLLAKVENHIEGLKLLQQILNDDGESSRVSELEREIEKYKLKNAEKCHQLVLEAHLEEKNDPNKADLMLENCLKYDPTNEEAMLRRGHLIVRNKMAPMYMKAKEMFSDVVDRDPHNLKATLGLALIYQVTGRYEEAKDMHTAVLRQNPKHIEALYNLSHLLSVTGDCHGAVEHLTNVLQLRPGFVEAKKLLERCSIANETGSRSKLQD